MPLAGSWGMATIVFWLVDVTQSDRPSFFMVLSLNRGLPPNPYALL